MGVAIEIQVSERAAQNYQQSSQQTKQQVAKVFDSWFTPQTTESRKQAGLRLKNSLDETERQAEAAGVMIEDIIDDPKIIKNLQ